MKAYQFEVSCPVNYVMTGKFEAQSESWTQENISIHEFLLFVVTEGTLYISYKNKKHSVKEGEYLLLPPSIANGEDNFGIKTSNCSFYWMNFSYNKEIVTDEIHKFRKILHDNLYIQEQNALTNPSKVIVLMKQLQDFVYTNYNKTSLNYMTTTILCELSSQAGLKEEIDNNATYKNKQVFHDIVDYIKRNPQLNLKVSDISERFGYNEKYLSHLFGKLSGITLKQYIMRNKMEIANYLLTDTNLPISDISITLGFQDAHNFMRAYKKISGLTPSEYRNAFSHRLLYHSYTGIIENNNYVL